MIVKISSPYERDARTRRQKQLRLGELFGVKEIPAVDHRRRQGAVIDLRSRAWTPRGADLSRAKPVRPEDAKKEVNRSWSGAMVSKDGEANSSFTSEVFRLRLRRSPPDSDLKPRADRAASEGSKQSEERYPTTSLTREECPEAQA